MPSPAAFDPPTPLPTVLPALPVAPWQPSGTVLVAALNDAATLDALGAAAHAPPYQRPPRAPVLVVKPRHTWSAAGATFVLPPGHERVQVGASLALVVGRRIAAGADATTAHAAIAAWALAVDLTLPTDGWYRPAVRSRAAVGSLRLAAPVAGPPPWPAGFEASLDGGPPWQADTRRFVHEPGALLADIAEFMTLQPGDIVLAGVPEGAPSARAGQRVRVAGPGAAVIEFGVQSEAGHGQ
jgi:5-oxopent-3-ene-1,2,5-tricarboxylate decarboxylase/2-hydroxyhepta-2,4-diene-1,7-dioate isomerase